MICILALSLAVPGSTAAPSHAQSSGITWSRPTNLSNTPQASAHPVIVADDYGIVHVFWSEEVGGSSMRPGENIQNTGNSILYTRWDGLYWTPPVDVLYVPGEDLAEWPAVAIDEENTIHAVWTSFLNVYYSSASAWEADSARGWREPVALPGQSSAMPWSTDIAVTVDGTVHVAYGVRGDERAVQYVKSKDGGETWSIPIRLSLSLAPPEEYLAVIQIVADDAGRLHAVWQTNQAEGTGQGVYYARSVNGGDTWSAPTKLARYDPGDFVTGVPYLIPVTLSEIHLIYVDGAVVGSQGRYHRLSHDGGKTWSAAAHVFDNMMGMNGYVAPVIDDAGELHMIITMRTVETQVTGIYYAHWLGTSWSRVTPVDVSVSSAHYTSAALRLGKEIHVVYTQLTGGEIWHLSGTIPGIEERQALLPPTLTAASPSPTERAPAGDLGQQEPVPTSFPPSLTPAATTTTIPPLILAVASSLLVVGAAVAAVQMRSHLASRRE
ncbi:MAG: exo-alpha-sialidase [Anaerolineae bacterium]|nr:exo-alpha-sialidase [Anaerolineae bacterium]